MLSPTYPAFSARSRGFTLIELLTVIAIIGILAAILIPTVGTVRQTAREAQNLSNLRQLSQMILVYTVDHKGRFPIGWETSTSTSWVHRLGPYFNGPRVGNRQVIGDLTKSPTAQLETTAQFPMHYGVNDSVCFDPNHPQPHVRLLNSSVERVQRPSQVILIADTVQSPNYNGNSADTFWYPYDMANLGTTVNLQHPIPYGINIDRDVHANQGHFRYRNRGSMHAAHVDGSAKAYRAGTVTYGNVIFFR
jgi:prepilin-type N-terminal cleavage/methylation domain-containing protein